MCLGIPGQVVDIVDPDLQLAKVDVGGVRRTISIGLLDPDEGTAQVGDWVLIHVGFALARINEEEAQSTLKALEEIGEQYEQELRELKASRIE